MSENGATGTIDLEQKIYALKIAVSDLQKRVLNNYLTIAQMDEVIETINLAKLSFSEILASFRKTLDASLNEIQARQKLLRSKLDD